MKMLCGLGPHIWLWATINYKTIQWSWFLQDLSNTVNRQWLADPELAKSYAQPIRERIVDGSLAIIVQENIDPQFALSPREAKQENKSFSICNHLTTCSNCCANNSFDRNNRLCFKNMRKAIASIRSNVLHTLTMITYGTLLTYCFALQKQHILTFWAQYGYRFIANYAS